jgi:hypothetical protein
MRVGVMRLAIAAAVCSTIGGVALAASAPGLPSAFSRPAVGTDQLPARFRGVPGEGLPYDSRRIATLPGRKRDWSVFVFKQTVKYRYLNPSVRPSICLFIFTSGKSGQDVGGGCSPAELFLGPTRHVSASATGRVLAGVTSDRVVRVVVIGSQGKAHDVPLSADKGFIFNCRAYNGCACVVSRLQAFDKFGNRITNQNWLSPARNCRR